MVTLVGRLSVRPETFYVTCQEIYRGGRGGGRFLLSLDNFLGSIYESGKRLMGNSRPRGVGDRDYFSADIKKVRPSLSGQPNRLTRR